LIKVLNLYAGVGGNRKLWEDVEVVAVEQDSKIVDTYNTLYPQDLVVEGDAHEVLLHHYQDFDFIWSSPPCQSHSRMIRGGKNRKPRYPDLKLYEEILFLKHNFKGGWVVENVRPYYEPLIPPSATMGRHYFWSNFPISTLDLPSPPNFINATTVAGSEKLKDWLGIHYEGNLYVGGNHCPGQVLRNCVHPSIGAHVLKEFIEEYR
jgi:DNA (cytosine-5)-methyltransferase 1